MHRKCAETPSRLNHHDNNEYFDRIHEWKKLKWSEESRGSLATTNVNAYERGRQIKIASRIIVFVTINIVFSLCGASVFMLLERDAHVIHHKQLYREFLVKYGNLSKTKLHALHQAAELQCRLDHLIAESWSFHHAIHLSYSIITTIGFGEITPQTVAGRLVSILYAVIGIFLFVLFLASTRLLINDTLYQISLSWSNCTFTCFTRCLRNRRRLITCMTITIFILLNLVIASWMARKFHRSTFEQWFTSFYHTFIAVTTIGFGDGVVLDEINRMYDESSLSKEVVSIFFMLIIILILILFSSLFELIKQNEVREISRRISHFVNSFNQSHYRVARKLSALSRIGASVGPGSHIPTIDEGDEGRTSSPSVASLHSESMAEDTCLGESFQDLIDNMDELLSRGRHSRLKESLDDSSF